MPVSTATPATTEASTSVLWPQTKEVEGMSKRAATRKLKRCDLYNSAETSRCTARAGNE